MRDDGNVRCSAGPRRPAVEDHGLGSAGLNRADYIGDGVEVAAGCRTRIRTDLGRAQNGQKLEHRPRFPQGVGHIVPTEWRSQGITGRKAAELVRLASVVDLVGKLFIERLGLSGRSIMTGRGDGIAQDPLEPARMEAGTGRDAELLAP